MTDEKGSRPYHGPFPLPSPELVASAKRLKERFHATHEKQLRDNGWTFIQDPRGGKGVGVWVPPGAKGGLFDEPRPVDAWTDTNELPVADECFFCGLPLQPGYSGHVCPDPPAHYLVNEVEYLAPDYEAMGYPETASATYGLDLDVVAEVSCRVMSRWLSSMCSDKD